MFHELQKSIHWIQTFRDTVRNSKRNSLHFFTRLPWPAKNPKMSIQLSMCNILSQNHYQLSSASNVTGFYRWWLTFYKYCMFALWNKYPLINCFLHTGLSLKMHLIITFWLYYYCTDQIILKIWIHHARGQISVILNKSPTYIYSYCS